jgi:hypothetical protein
MTMPQVSLDESAIRSAFHRIADQFVDEMIVWPDEPAGFKLPTVEDGLLACRVLDAHGGEISSQGALARAMLFDPRKYAGRSIPYRVAAKRTSAFGATLARALEWHGLIERDGLDGATRRALRLSERGRDLAAGFLSLTRDEWGTLEDWRHDHA